MEKPLSPIFDDYGMEVSRDAFWGQKELGAELRTTAQYVGTLLRLVGLLQDGSKDPSGEALRTGAAIYVTVATADGPHRYPRWRKELVLGVLSRALRDHPKPLTATDKGNQRNAGSFHPQPQSFDERLSDLERRVERLERQANQGFRSS